MSERGDRKQLYVLRHADAGDPGAWSGDDAARPLSPKGREQAERLATFLHGVRLSVDAVISSPKIRARETAEIVADGLGHAGQVRVDDRLASGVRPATVDDVLRDAGFPARVVIVGHDPDFSALLAALVGAPELTLKKGAMARVDLRGQVADADGTLRWLVPPELLDRERR